MPVIKIILTTLGIYSFTATATPQEFFESTVTYVIGCHQVTGLELTTFDEATTCGQRQLWNSDLKALALVQLEAFNFESMTAPGAHGPRVGRYHGVLSYPCLEGDLCRLDIEFIYSGEDILGSATYELPDYLETVLDIETKVESRIDLDENPIDPDLADSIDGLSDCLSYSQSQSIVKAESVIVPAFSTRRIQFDISGLANGMVPTCGLIKGLNTQHDHVRLAFEVPGTGELPMPRVYVSSIDSPHHQGLNDVFVQNLGPGDDVIEGTWFLRISNDSDSAIKVHSREWLIFGRFD